MAAESEPYRVLERVFREEAGRLTASLVRLLGDFDLAEELVSAAMVQALEHWPRDGIPERPASWLLTTARRKGLDQVRRASVHRKKLELVAAVPDVPATEADDRLRLIFMCCHPALSREAQIALTLRAVAGLTAQEIARAFLASEGTIVRRISRAKRKIVSAGIPYRVPDPADLRPRLQEALTVIYLVFNEGYLTTAGDEPVRQDLVRDAEWLAALVTRLLPMEPEPLGLLALIRLHLARWQARLDAAGGLVLLEHQDRSLWDRGAIAAGGRLIEQATSLGPPGPFVIEAAIAAVHSEAPSWKKTDWRQVLALYDALLALEPSPVIALSRAIAQRYVYGAEPALAGVDRLSEALSGYHLFHATRARLLRDLGRTDDALEADRRALELATNRAERALIEGRVAAAPSR